MLQSLFCGVLLASEMATVTLPIDSVEVYYAMRDYTSVVRLVEAKGNSVCEWKGRAVYRALARVPELPVAWSYPRPRPRFDKIRNRLAFYPGRVECYVDGERVQAQAGGFYGGWITSDVVGPFKGEPGTGHW